jgi:hypothetical protein
MVATTTVHRDVLTECLIGILMVSMIECMWTHFSMSLIRIVRFLQRTIGGLEPSCELRMLTPRVACTEMTQARVESHRSGGGSCVVNAQGAGVGGRYRRYLSIPVSSPLVPCLRKYRLVGRVY